MVKKEKQKTAYLSSLTSLRGIAALLVILFHFDVVFSRLAAPDSPFFIRKGYLWVDFFFLLSGFIIMHVYGKSFSNGLNFQNFKQFMRARFARIYPLHIFSFLSVIALFIWYRGHYELNAIDKINFDLKAIPTNLLLLQSMGFHKYLSWDTPSWSISTEWWMYVAFPFVLVPFRKVVAWKKRAVLLFIIIGYLFIIYYLYPLSKAASPFPSAEKNYLLDVTYDYGFFRCFLGFLFGMLLYEFYRIKWGYSYLKKSGALLLSTAIIFVALSLKIPDIITVMIFGSIILMSAYTEGAGKLFLNLKPLVFLGDISYSLYLMHMPLLFLMLFLAKKYPMMISTSLAVSWLYFLAYLASVMIISTLTYNFVEVPMRKRINPSLHQRNN